MGKWDSQLDEEGAVITGGGSSFAFPLGNIGPWHKQDAYEVQGYNALEVAKALGLVPDASRSAPAKDDNGPFETLWYVAKRYTEANEVAKKLSQDGKGFARLVTQFHCDPNEVLPEPLNFDLTYTVAKRGYGTRFSEAYQLITVVSIVHAYAKNMGWEVPAVAFSALIDPKNFKAFEGEALGKYYEDLATQRYNLWHALGEENFKADTYDGAKSAKGVKLEGPNVTKAPKLSEALKFVQLNWKSCWARMGQVADPARDRNRIPVMVALYDDEAQARAALHKNDDADNPYAGLFVPESFSGVAVEEYISALMTEVLPKFAAYNEAVTGPKKVKAKAEYLTSLKDFELNEEQWAAWYAKLNS